MSMIKRGKVDNDKPEIIAIAYRCPSCGHFEQKSETSLLGRHSTRCPKCQGGMIQDRASEGGSCPGGICNLD
jgi:predicted Zn-ribbon and HTH transcriptional regulator